MKYISAIGELLCTVLHVWATLTVLLIGIAVLLLPLWLVIYGVVLLWLLP